MSVTINVDSIIQVEKNDDAATVFNRVAKAIERHIADLEAIGAVADPLSIEVKRDGIFGGGKSLVVGMSGVRG